MIGTIKNGVDFIILVFQVVVENGMLLDSGNRFLTRGGSMTNTATCGVFSYPINMTNNAGSGHGFREYGFSKRWGLCLECNLWIISIIEFRCVK